MHLKKNQEETATFITGSFVLAHRSVADRLSSNATVSTGFAVTHGVWNAVAAPFCADDRTSAAKRSLRSRVVFKLSFIFTRFRPTKQDDSVRKKKIPV